MLDDAVWYKNDGSSINIVVIDSGVSCYHSSESFINGGITMTEDGQVIYDEYEDKLGHGTAVVDIIHKLLPGAKLFIIKIFEEGLGTTIYSLIKALNYVYTNLNCDMVQMSVGVTIIDDYPILDNIIDKLYRKGVKIISAFDNLGAISYPAACQNVIGVDTSKDLKELDEYEIIDGGIIDIRIADKFHRVRWVNPPNTIIKGSSFSCSYVTSYVAKILEYYGRNITKRDILNIMKKNAKNIYTVNYQKKESKEGYFKLKNAIIFPFNKEVHSIIKYSEMLDFNICALYDTRYSYNINKNVKELIHDYKNEDLYIEDYRKIEWNGDFDTIICGHCKEISDLIKEDILEYFIEKCIKYKKNMYCFDDITKYIDHLPKKYSKLFKYPYIDNNSIPLNRFDKLRKSSKPIIGVFGTSSSQGKYTLQLELRKLFNKKGYVVGQIGTEPSGELFGFDAVYPMGYNSAVYVNQYSSVAILNEMIWNIEKKDVDIIIVGGQSGIIPYDTGNLKQFNFKQYDFIFGTTPDVSIICINPYDDIEYIRDTIKFVESSSGGKVLGLVLYPMGIKYGPLDRLIKSRLHINELNNIKDKITNTLEVSVYVLGEIDHMSKLVTRIEKYFEQEE